MKREGKIRNCAYCGEEFEASQEFRSYKRRYCSLACHGKANHERTVSKYPPKEEVVRLYVDEGLSDRDLGRHFGHSHQWSLSVRRHYGIAGGRRGPRKKPLHKKRDRGRWAISLKPSEECRNCGGAGSALHLHHAVPRSLSPSGKYDLRNGLQLCGNCHLGWHHRRVNIYRDVFTSDEWSYIQTLIGPVWLEERYPGRPEDGGSLEVGHCKHGHPWTEENTYLTPEGRRRCRACGREREGRYRAARKAVAA